MGTFLFFQLQPLLQLCLMLPLTSRSGGAAGSCEVRLASRPPQGVEWQKTYALEVGGLDLAVQVGPLEDLVASHTLVLEGLAGLASEDGDLRAVALVHGSGEESASGSTTSVTD